MVTNPNQIQQNHTKVIYVNSISIWSAQIIWLSLVLAIYMYKTIKKRYTRNLKIMFQVTQKKKKKKKNWQL